MVWSAVTSCDGCCSTLVDDCALIMPPGLIYREESAPNGAYNLAELMCSRTCFDESVAPPRIELLCAAASPPTEDACSYCSD